MLRQRKQCEELESVSDTSSDKLWHARTVRTMRGEVLRVLVEDIKRVKVTAERLCLVSYAGGELGHLTAGQVWDYALSADLIALTSPAATVTDNVMTESANQWGLEGNAVCSWLEASGGRLSHCPI